MIRQAGTFGEAVSHPLAQVASDRRPPVWWWGAAALGCVLIGATLGLQMTAYGERHAKRIGAVSIGAWSYAPDAGTAALNPYLRARFAQDGEIPTPAAIGLTLVASRTTAGVRLDRRCTYSIAGPMPRARFWTIEAADLDGRPVADAADRRSFTAQDVVRETAGALTITVSPTAEPGNWLPAIGSGRMILVLRVYEPSVAIPGAGLPDALAVPTIEGRPCP